MPLQLYPQLRHKIINLLFTYTFCESLLETPQTSFCNFQILTNPPIGVNLMRHGGKMELKIDCLLWERIQPGCWVFLNKQIIFLSSKNFVFFFFWTFSTNFSRFVSTISLPLPSLNPLKKLKLMLMVKILTEIHKSILYFICI